MNMGGDVLKVFYYPEFVLSKNDEQILDILEYFLLEFHKERSYLKTMVLVQNGKMYFPSQECDDIPFSRVTLVKIIYNKILVMLVDLNESQVSLQAFEFESKLELHSIHSKVESAEKSWSLSSEEPKRVHSNIWKRLLGRIKRRTHKPKREKYFFEGIQHYQTIFKANSFTRRDIKMFFDVVNLYEMRDDSNLITLEIYNGDFVYIDEFPQIISVNRVMGYFIWKETGILFLIIEGDGDLKWAMEAFKFKRMERIKLFLNELEKSRTERPKHHEIIDPSEDETIPTKESASIEFQRSNSQVYTELCQNGMKKISKTDEIKFAVSKSMEKKCEMLVNHYPTYFIDYQVNNKFINPRDALVDEEKIEKVGIKFDGYEMSLSSRGHLSRIKLSRIDRYYPFDDGKIIVLLIRETVEEKARLDGFRFQRDSEAKRFLAKIFDERISSSGASS